MRTLLTIWMAIWITTSVSAADGDVNKETVNGVEWTYMVLSEANKTCKVGVSELKYSDSHDEYYWENIKLAIDVNTTGAISIPSKLNDYTVVAVAEGAFIDCKISSVIIPEGVNLDEGRAFVSCDNLTSVQLPEGLNATGLATFHSCKSLVSLSVAEGNKTYDSRDNCNAIIETETNKLVANLYSATIIPSFVKIIGAFMFEGSYITAIDIPEGVTTIEKRAFSSCNLNTVSFPSTLTSIGDEAFSRCKNLTTVILPASLTTIGSDAFESCQNLRDVYNLASVPQTLDSDYSFSTGYKDGLVYDATLHVLPGCKSAYQAANIWKNFSNILEDAVSTDMNIRRKPAPSFNTRYTLEGRLSTNNKGIILIRLDDGSVKKIL